MPDPSDQIAFALGRLAVLWRAGGWQAGVAEGLNPAQAEILGHLSRRGPVRQVDLAAALGVSAASLSDSVASLAAKGLVIRQPDPEDGRARRVGLSAAGQTIPERLGGASCAPPAPLYSPPRRPARIPAPLWTPPGGTRTGALTGANTKRPRPKAPPPPGGGSKRPEP